MTSTMRKVRVYGWARSRESENLLLPFEVEFYVHEVMSVEDTFYALYPHAQFGHIVEE